MALSTSAGSGHAGHYEPLGTLSLFLSLFEVRLHCVVRAKLVVEINLSYMEMFN